jgi:hypothetical protein
METLERNDFMELEKHIGHNMIVCDAKLMGSLSNFIALRCVDCKTMILTFADEIVINED